MFILRDENSGLKNRLKRVRKMRRAIAERLIFYIDFVNTRLLEFEDEMEEVQEQEPAPKDVPSAFSHPSPE